MNRRDWFAFDRTDRWGFGLLLALVVVVTAATRVVAPIIEWVRGEDLAVPFFSDVDIPALAAAGLGHSQASYSLLIPDASGRQRWLDLLPGVGYGVLVCAVVWLLFRLMVDIGRGEPFAPGNVRRLRLLAGVLLVGWTVLYFVEATCSLAILDQVDLQAAGVEGGPRAVLSLPIAPFIAGMAVALVAEAFKAGSRLKDDVEGLV